MDEREAANPMKSTPPSTSFSMLSICSLVLCVFLGMPSPACASEPKLKAIYGFSKTFPVFSGKSNDQIAKWLLDRKFNAIFGGYKDRKLVETLKRHGIQVYAEAAIFYSSTYWKEFPKSRPVNAKGQPIDRVDWYRGLCPNQDFLIKKRLGFIRQLVKKYKVDGVWLDFVRYPCHWEVLEPKLEQTCFCPVCLKKFEKDTGIKLPEKNPAAFIQENHKDRFADWKTDRIAGFVKKAAVIIKNENPNVIVGLFGVPWKKGERDNAIINIIAQDYQKLAPHIDIFSPMVYHKMVGENPPWISGMVRYLDQVTKKPVIPIIQAVSEPTRLPDDEFIRSVQEALESPSKGVIILSMKYFLKEHREKAWLRALPTP